MLVYNVEKSKVPRVLAAEVYAQMVKLCITNNPKTINISIPEYTTTVFLHSTVSVIKRVVKNLVSKPDNLLEHIWVFMQLG